MNIAQQYLSLYQQLSDPKKTSEANKTLYEIQRNQQSWYLAKQLLNRSPNDSAYIHGCQLLSKKLNRPYPYAHQQRLGLLQYIYSKQLNPTLYYCLAKLHLHLNLEQIKLPTTHQNSFNLLSILQWMPEASKMITLAPIKQVNNEENMKHRQYELTMKYFEKYSHILIDYFHEQEDKVISCIDNYITNTYKIKDIKIIRLLLSKQIDQISIILETILQNQSFPELNQQIYEYLVRNGLKQQKSIEQMQQIILVYISFCSNLELLKLDKQFLIQILTKVIQFIRRQLFQNLNGNYPTLQSSFKFWSHLSITLNKKSNQTNISQQQVCYEAFIEVWKILIQKSILKELPEFKKQQSNSLVISLDDSDDDELQITAKIEVVGKFRTLAQDYILLIYNSVSHKQEYQNKALRILYDLTKTQDPLILQVSIFTIACIIQNCRYQGMNAIGQVIQSIISHEHAKVPYIWQQLIKLMSKFGSQTTSSMKITRLTLLVLKQSVLIPQLCSLASQTFNNIITSCQQSSQKNNLRQYFEEFINILYHQIYMKLLVNILSFPCASNNTSPDNAFESLTKSIIIFIYSYKKDTTYYIDYLSSIKQHLINPSYTIIQRKVDVISYLSIAHSFVSEQQSKLFTPIFAQFMVEYIQIFKESLQLLANQNYCKQRQEHKQLMAKIGLVINSVSGFKPQIWAHFICQITIKALNLRIEKQAQWNKIIYRYFNLIVAFMKVQMYDQEQYPKAIIKLTQIVYPYISEKMTKINPQKEYQLVLQVLSFHFELLKRHVTLISHYNPDQLLIFLKQKIIGNTKFWEYSIFKVSLAILRILIQKKYQMQIILDMVFSQYQRLSDCFWKSLESIFIECYKQGGIQLFQIVLKHRQSKIIPPNPLFQCLKTALENSDGKSIKAIFQNIQ